MTKFRIRGKITTAISIALTAATLMTAGSAYAAESQSESRNLFEQTGITVQLYALQDMVNESSQTHAARCGSAGSADYITGFNAESVIVDMLSAFNKSHTRSIKPVEIWYRSSLAKKIKAAELEPIDQSALSSFQQSAHYKNQHRSRLINSIVDSLQIHEFIAILGTEVEYAGILHSGCITNADTPAKARWEQKLADITREDKNLTATLLRGSIVVDTAYLFRNLSDEELAEYESFTSSDTGMFFYSNLINAVQDSLKRAGDRLDNSLKSDLHGSFDF